MSISYLNNPSAVCDYSITVENREESVVEAVRRVIPAWSSALTADTKLTVLTGGITNTMYLLAWKEERVLVRLFGENTELMIDRNAENKLFAALGTLGMGCPTFHGLFNNGRVEGYLNARSITADEMKEPFVYRRVAASAARFHTRGSTIDEALVSHQNRMHSPGEGMYMQYYELTKGIVFRAEGEKKAKLDALKLPEMYTEIVWLCDWLKVQAAESRAAALNLPLVDSAAHTVFIPAAMLADSANHRNMARFLAYQEVLCHHDLLSGNLMMDRKLEELVQAGKEPDDTEGITLIDYEYAAFTYRAFDLGNFFCEFAGFDSSIEEAYPGPHTRRAVIRAYFDACAAEFEQQEASSTNMEVRIWRYWQGLCKDGSGEASAAANSLVEEFEVCTNQLAICAHVLWFLWGIVQDEYSANDFDYLDYSRVRLEGYNYHKKTFHS